MSKLDDIQTTCDNCKYAPALDETCKGRIKDSMLEIINTTGLVGPVHPQSQMYIRDLIQKVEAL